MSKCINELELSDGIAVIEPSSVYATEPVGFADQPAFLNMVVKVETRLPIIQLLKLTQQIEKKLGRKKRVHWGPRLIDIDILSYNDELIYDQELIVPHSQMHLRRFVLIPLKEISENYIHPRFHKNINQLLNECPDKSQVTMIGNVSSLF